MASAEFVCSITFTSPPEPDDPRPLLVQANEQIESLAWMLADIGAVLEVLRVETT